jgi:UDP-glucuronate 4-epimerase
MKTILLTGGAGFIGSHLAEALLHTGEYRVCCLDNLDDFYAPQLKEQNLEMIIDNPYFRFIHADVACLSSRQWDNLFEADPPDKIIHLAAKAGVRPSLDNPQGYYNTNVQGTLNLLEFSRRAGIKEFIFASSSSVYGDHPATPWRETLSDIHPVSPYASSKLASEELGRVYAHLYDISFTALRLFTVYGPRQRPDLAIHKFHDRIKNGQEITLYGDGSTRRDYTYINDITTGIMASLDLSYPEKFRIFNLGSGRPISLVQMVRTLEEVMQTRAILRFSDEQPGDVKSTWADLSLAGQWLDYHPEVTLEEGITNFVHWKETDAAVLY